MVTLVTISSGHRLAVAPGASYERMCSDYGATIPVTSAYRSPEDQARLRALYLRGEWPSYVAPVELSTHPKGIALDFGARARLWLDDHADAYGWISTDPTEWWHRVYFESRDLHLPRPAPEIPAPTPLHPFDEEANAVKDQIVARYVYVLRRMPDPIGLADALIEVGAARKTLDDIERELRASPEYRNMPADERDKRSAALAGARWL